jgi:hypothetical protein
MRRLLFRTGLGATLSLLCACDHEHLATPTSIPTIVGSGNVASQSRAVSGFVAVTVTAPLRVVLEQAESESLVVTADDNVIPVVQSEVRDGRLFLGFAPNTSLTRTREILCRITMRGVREVEASGAARLEMSGLDTTSLIVRLSGAVMASARGTAERLTLDVSGASRWSAGDLRSREVTANVSGASYGCVRATDLLVVSAYGVSILEYWGDPQVASNVDGLSLVRRVGP